MLSLSTVCNISLVWLVFGIIFSDLFLKKDSSIFKILMVLGPISMLIYGIMVLFHSLETSDSNYD